MSKYPEVITNEVLQAIVHVTDAEIRQDIADTEVEIVRLEKETEGHRLLAESQAGTPGGRMSAFYLDAKRAGLADRRLFVRFLRSVQQRRVEIQGENNV